MRKGPRSETKEELERELQDILYRVTADLPRMRELSTYFRKLVHNKRVARRVRFFYLPLFALSSFNGKTLPALKILLNLQEKGKLRRGAVIIGATSGNTGVGWAYLARLFGVKFIAVVKSTVPQGKLGQLELAGATIIFSPDGVSPIEYTHKLCEKNGKWIELNQYKDWGSVQAHEEWTMPHIRDEMLRLQVDPSAICVPVGTTSLLVATRALSKYWPNLKRIGAACVSEDEIIPGARTEESLKETHFGYASVLSFPLVKVDKKDAFATSKELVRHYVTGGPTSGMALFAFCTLVNKLYAKGGMKALKPLMNEAGEIILILVMMDAHLPYAAEYKKVLGEAMQ